MAVPLTKFKAEHRKLARLALCRYRTATDGRHLGGFVLLYRFLITVALIPYGAVVLWRVLRGVESWRIAAERLFGVGPASDGPHIWVHAASNGELASALPLIEAIVASRPDLSVLVTTTSVSGRDMALARGYVAMCAPLDLAVHVRKILRRYDIRGLIVLESEIWPNMIIEAAKYGTPAQFIGARLSAGTARSWGRLGFIAYPVFASIAQVFPQDARSGERFATLGAKNVGAVFDLKSHFVAPIIPLGDNRAQTLLAASTHEGEDEIILRAYAAIRRKFNTANLIIAPRHPKRGPEIEQIAHQQGLAAQLLSKGGNICDVLIADTLGEMPRWYAQAGFCLVGGSLVPRGGHTPYEPAAYGCVLASGPNVQNFGTIYEVLFENDAAIRLTDETSCLHAFEAFLSGKCVDMPIKATQLMQPQADIAHLQAQILARLT